MWKIAVGYVLLLLWCYARAATSHRRAADAASANADASSPPVALPVRVLSAVLLVIAVGVVIWGSGWNFVFWLPAGFLLAGFVQTLIPLRESWR